MVPSGFTHFGWFLFPDFSYYAASSLLLLVQRFPLYSIDNNFGLQGWHHAVSIFAGNIIAVVGVHRARDDPAFVPALCYLPSR